MTEPPVPHVPGQQPLFRARPVAVCAECGLQLPDHTGGATLEHLDDGTHAYTPGPATFTCPVCGAVSSHPVDVVQGYCSRCHDWTGDL